jgi:hypothetical protein
MSHSKCIGNSYIGVTSRFDVPVKFINWKVPFPEYQPVNYNDPSFLSAKPPVWADSVDVKTVDFSKRLVYGTITFRDGFPINPVGRTGVTGRGVLGKWGPNSAGDPLFTKWKRDVKGNIIKINGKPILMFVAIERVDGGDGGNARFALPGGMVDYGESISMTILREFNEEALGGLQTEEINNITSQLSQMMKETGKVIYRGYVDDRRNTDNAWMVTTCIHVHDETGAVFDKFPLKGGDDAKQAFWMEFHPDVEDFTLYASHADWVRSAYDSFDTVPQSNNLWDRFIKFINNYITCRFV